jgi:uncharacterized integral membrane protein
MKALKAFLLGLSIVVLILFIVQNLQALTRSEVLKLDLMFASFHTPPLNAALLLTSCFALGYLAAFVIGYVSRRRLKKTIKELNQRQTRIEAELNSLRNLPITGEQVRTLPNGRLNGEAVRNHVG